MVEEVLISLSLIIAAAAILTIIARAIKQPPIIAYLISGIIVGPLVLNLVGPSSSSSGLMQTFAHIGVAFLLFIVGLNLDFRVLKEVGKVSVLTGVVEIIITGSIGALIALGIGFSSTTALYLGVILAFSSTVVVVKIFSDKKEIETLHGRIALGILIVEDFAAALALMIVPLINSGAQFYPIFYSLSMAVGLIIVVFLISFFLLNKILDYIARNQEALFLFGIAWALAFAAIFNYLGFSLEIGALIAGMSLASSKYTLELGGKMKPLRDFFVVIFFVFFGSQLTKDISPALIKDAIIFSAFIFIGKPIIVMTLLRFFGYKKKTNFLAGSSLAQISEFSLILALLGFNLGRLNQEMMNLAILVSLITISLSSYSIYYAHSIFNKLSKILTIFEGKNNQKEPLKEKPHQIILFGYHSLGYKILQTLKKMKKDILIVDHNPQVVNSLAKERVDCIYGDASDRDFLGEVGLEDAEIVISTVPDDAASLTILEKLKRVNSKAIFIAATKQPRSALNLYKAGVDYVIIPLHLGGEYASHMIDKLGLKKEEYKKMGKQHFKELKESKNKSGYL